LEGLCDINDTLIGNASSINATVNLNLSVDNNTANKSYSGQHNLTIAGDGIRISFNHNFSDSKLYLTNVSINRSEDSITISGLNVTNKTVWFKDNNYSWVCVKDVDMLQLTASDNCTGPDELLFTGNQTAGNISCLKEGGYFIVSGLKHSQIMGNPAECFEHVDCPHSQCTELSGCYFGTHRDYHNIPNMCIDNICTFYECDDYTLISTDNDDDGYDIECEEDCDDDDPLINPGANDIPDDGIDQNCDNVDEGSGGGTDPPDPIEGVPEFTPITLFLAMIFVITGIFMMRKR